MSHSETKTKPISDEFNEQVGEWNYSSPKRPKRPPPFSIRFTDKERAILERERDGKPMAVHIRQKLFEAEYTHRQRGRKNTVNKALLGQALGVLGSSRIAQNMNQIAKAANMGTLPVSSELHHELHDACNDIKLMRDALIDALGIKVEW